MTMTELNREKSEIIARLSLAKAGKIDDEFNLQGKNFKLFFTFFFVCNFIENHIFVSKITE